MFDLLRPLTKLLTVIAFITAYLALNAAFLFVVSACFSSSSCIGTGATAGVVDALKQWSGLFLPGNFWPCMEFIITASIFRRAYDFIYNVMEVTAKAS